MSLRSPTQVSGYTLVEVAMVALIIGLVAAIALPTGTNHELVKVEAAASEVATAVRFARDESMRTGTSHGVRASGTNNRVRVFRLDGGGVEVYDIYHPIAKQLWDVDFDTSPHYPDVVLTRANTWRGTCNKPRNVAFRSDGTPSCMDPPNVLLDESVITIQHGNFSRSVHVGGFTGRVWVQ